MSKTVKILIMLALAVAVAITIVVKQDGPLPEELNAKSNPSSNFAQADSDSQSLVPAPESPRQLPRLVDVGADKCIPCKMMAPILEELKAEYAGRFEVRFIDVWKQPSEGRKYGIKIIPTQIFFDASGKELFRHEGFFSREDILGKWKELGVDIEKGQTNEKSN